MYFTEQQRKILRNPISQQMNELQLQLQKLQQNKLIRCSGSGSGSSNSIFTQYYTKYYTKLYMYS